MTKRFLYILLFFILILPEFALAQFYNGYQMNFGKNRVQYRQFEWQYFRLKKFDTYYYVDGSGLAQFASNVAEKEIKEYERFFEFQFDQRLIFLVYNNLSDFRQSNIGYVSSSTDNNIGGTTTIVQNRAFVYFEQDYKKFEEQIKGAITEMMINQMLFGGSFTAQMATSTLLSMPQWYTKGLSKYISEGWDPEIDNKVRDAVMSGSYDNINRLEGEASIIAGQSIWNYIAKKYGKNVIPNILYLTRISKSIDSGFMFVLGMSFKQLTYEWLDYYDSQYYKLESQKNLPKEDKELFKTKKQRVYQQIKISPDGKYYAFTTNEIGRSIVWLYNIETGKKKAVVRREHRLQQITDYTYPLLAWHPSGDKLTYITEEKGGVWLNYFDIETKESTKLRIFKFSKILDYEFSLDGRNFVFTAVQDGQIDVFTYSLLAHTHKAITNDKTDEKNARFLNNSSSVIFASNRLSDSLTAVNTQKNYDLFVYTEGNSKLKRITETPDVNEKEPINLDKMQFLYLSDQNGIFNLSVAEYDSSISFIDTSIHYNYFSRTAALTDYKRNINEYWYNIPQSKLSGIVHYNKKDRIYSTDFNTNNHFQFESTKHTEWKLNEIKLKEKKALEKLKKDTILPVEVNAEPSDTNNIDFNNYIFDITSLDKNELFVDSATAEKNKNERFKPRYYFTSFYQDKVVTQIDFGFLNQSYQTYTGSAVYFNPGFNIFMKVGVVDLFEDYRFTAGARLSANFNSTEFLFSLENLKKRLDKQYIFHRQAIEEYGQNFIKKTYSNQFMYILRWPFSQVSSIRATAKYRNDHGVFKSVSQQTLEAPDNTKNWAGLKAEYVFDNSLSLGLNLYRGWRTKFFVEAYKQIDGDHPDLYVLGFDVRYYQKVHRTLILATRIAGSSSFGENRLMYYLGSTDNWINFSRTTPTFDESVKRNQEIDWAFQALATNMRGFSQNVRNGNTFLVMNNELRVPIIRYLSGAPISSAFLHNFQLVGFFDIGTAWTGASPYSTENLYNQDDHIQGPVTIIIDNQKSPFVYGYGGGVRSKLLGYFVRADVAWGIDGDVQLPRIFYLSLSMDF